MNKNGIAFEFYLTKAPRDGTKVVKELDFDKFSALVAVGGDGTVNEVMNGIMQREDGKRLPLGVLPNGSGDQVIRQFGVGLNDIANSLKLLMKGQTVKIDVLKNIIDYENEDELNAALQQDSSLKKEDYLQYSVLGNGFGSFCEILENGNKLKPKWGNLAYMIALFDGWPELTPVYDVYADRGSIVPGETNSEEWEQILHDLPSQNLGVYNSFFHMSYTNDGLIELLNFNKKITMKTFFSDFNLYANMTEEFLLRPHIEFHRAKKFKVV